VERLGPRLRAVVGRARQVIGLCRIGALLVQIGFAREIQPGVFEIGVALGRLGDGGGQIGLGLFDLVLRLRLLKAQIGPGLVHLGRGLRGAVRIKRQVRPPLLGLDQSEEVARLDRIAFLDPQLLEPALDLRADDHVVGGDDAREQQMSRPIIGREGIHHRAHQGDGQDDERNPTFHDKGASGWTNKP
jgi:hypothetical protein